MKNKIELKEFQQLMRIVDKMLKEREEMRRFISPLEVVYNE